MELTVFEKTMMEEFLLNEYCDGKLTDQPWSFSLVENTANRLKITNHGGAAILGSLVKKGMMHIDGKIGGSESSCWLSEAGKNWMRDNLVGRFTE